MRFEFFISLPFSFKSCYRGFPNTVMAAEITSLCSALSKKLQRLKKKVADPVLAVER
jgi:hypothetical protein